MANCLLLLNTGDQVLLNTGDSVLLNDNTCSSGGVHGIWEGPLQKPQIIKPWKDKKQELEESSLELLIISEPTMGQLFKTDLSLLPYLKQYEDQLYDILLKPIKGTFNEWKIRNGAFIKKPFLNAELKMKYESPQISFRPIREQIFKKTLYGEKLHGIRIIEMVKELLGEIKQPKTLSFDFNDATLAQAVTNRPPVGEPIEQEREQDFTQPSSFIGTVTYTPDFNAMTIELNGNTYNYCSVPQSVYDSFEGAGSKGEFYNRIIKGQYSC